MSGEELVNEMKATRKMLAYFLQKMADIETKFDNFTEDKKQFWREEAARKRESTW